MKRQTSRRHPSNPILLRGLQCVCETLEARRLLSGQPQGGLLAGEIDLPRSLTDAEVEWLRENGWDALAGRAPTAPPSGPIDPVAEYEPMEALVLSWVGSSSLTNILGQIARRVTVEGNGRVYIGVTSASVQTSATNTLNSYGANLSNVTFFTLPLNSIWVRDYGPRYVYEGDVRVITDHRYNRPLRPQDDNQPVIFGQIKNHQYYEIGINNTTLVHGGGNYHLNATGDAYATQLIVNENPSLTAAQIQQIWSTYQNNNTTITSMFPGSVDATGHIDMWMQIYDDNKVFISDWPNAQGSVQDDICEDVAALMTSKGYQVTRIPAYLSGGTHYTYTNMVLFNDIVLLPQYNNGPGATVSNQVLSTVQAAVGPGKTVYPINADSIVTLAGVFHCIVQHIPMHKGLPGANGGLAPTAYLRGPNGGESLQAGDHLNIQWISDDDAPLASQGGVQSVDLLLSTDGGQTFPITVATNQPALGSWLWTVPGGISTTDARLRVVARDGAGNTGFDDSDANFTITDPIAPAVAASQFHFATAPHKLAFNFSMNVAASLGAEDVLLENLTTSQTIPPSDLSLSYDAGTNVATFTYTGGAGVLADGNYRVTLLAAGITSPGGTPMAADHLFDFRFLLGDATNDGTVNLADFNIVAQNFGQSPRDFTQGDFTYDGTVDLADFNVLAQRFGTVLAVSSTRATSGAFSTRAITGGETDDEELLARN